MRTVEVSRFVPATPRHLDSVLDPPTIVELEGSFHVLEVDEREDDWLIVAGSSALQFSLRFEELENGYFFEQEGGQNQPLETMETEVRYEPLNEGSEVTAISTVSTGMRPRMLTDRIAAWKRKGELDRALDELDRTVDA